MTADPPPSGLAGERVLVTGASGFIGRHLCRRLTGAGVEVHGVSRSDRKGTPGPARWWQADLENLAEASGLLAAVEPRVVYHLAGAVDGAPRIELLRPTLDSLVTTAVNLLYATTERGTWRLILPGSLEESDAADASLPPASPYAAAKTAATSHARMCHAQFGTPVVILRVFMGYGPGQPEWKLIPTVIGSLLRGVAPRLSSGRRELDWIYVDDIADAFVAAAVAPGIEGMSLDVGSGHVTSIRNLVKMLAPLVRPGIQPEFGVLSDRPERPPRVADTAQTLRHLVWQAETSLGAGLEKTVAWYRQQSECGFGSGGWRSCTTVREV